jgi:hypothetical protein
VSRISPGGLLVAGAVVPITAFGFLYRKSVRVRTLVRHSDPRKLTLVQTPRVIGAGIFAQRYFKGEIPARYGVTVALLDLAIGATAPLAARIRSARGLMIWNWIGLAALMVSVGSGVLTNPSPWQLFLGRKSSEPTKSLPLVLVPTLFGPATLTAHMIALAALHARRDSPLDDVPV